MFISIRLSLTHKMGLYTLTLAFYRSWLLVGPLACAYLTLKQQSDFLAVSLIWILSLFRGLGYDIVQHEWGEEASAYAFMFVVLKTIPYLDLSTPIAYIWIGVLGSEIGFVLLKRLPYFKLRDYLDVWRYTEDNTEVNAERARVKFSATNIGLLAVVSTIFGAIRFVLIFRNQYVAVFDTSVQSQEYGYNRPYIAADENGVLQYTPSFFDPIGFTYDSVALYTAVAELCVVIVFIYRIPFFSQPANDVWKSGLGVFMVYLYYNACTLIPIFNDSTQVNTVALTMSQCIVTFILIAGLNGFASSISNGVVMLVREVLISIKNGLFDVIGVLFAEPVLQVLFIIGNAFVIYNMNKFWYTSFITFSSLIRQVACVPMFVIENPVKVFYEFTNDDNFQQHLLPVLPEIASVRLAISKVMSLAYPSLRQACRGASYSFMPTNDYFISILFGGSFIMAAISSFQVFPEVAKYTRSPSFWSTAVFVQALALAVSQFAADAEVVVFWFFSQSTFTRVYTPTGKAVIAMQCFLMFISVLLARHRTNAEEFDKTLGIQGSLEARFGDRVRASWKKRFGGGAAGDAPPVGLPPGTPGMFTRSQRSFPAPPGGPTGKSRTARFLDRLRPNRESERPKKVDTSSNFFGASEEDIRAAARIQGNKSFGGDGIKTLVNAPTNVLKAGFNISSEVYEIIFSPGMVVMLIGVSVLWFAVHQGSPIDAIEFTRVFNSRIPEWAQVTPMDHASKYTSVFVNEMISKKAMMVVYVFEIFNYLLADQSFCFQIPGLKAVIELAKKAEKLAQATYGQATKAVSASWTATKTVTKKAKKFLKKIFHRRLLSVDAVLEDEANAAQHPTYRFPLLPRGGASIKLGLNQDISVPVVRVRNNRFAHLDPMTGQEVEMDDFDDLGIPENEYIRPHLTAAALRGSWNDKVVEETTQMREMTRSDKQRRLLGMGTRKELRSALRSYIGRVRPDLINANFEAEFENATMDLVVHTDEDKSLQLQNDFFVDLWIKTQTDYVDEQQMEQLPVPASASYQYPFYYNMTTRQMEAYQLNHGFSEASASNNYGPPTSNAVAPNAAQRRLLDVLDIPDTFCLGTILRYMSDKLIEYLTKVIDEAGKALVKPLKLLFPKVFELIDTLLDQFKTLDTYLGVFITHFSVLTVDGMDDLVRLPPHLGTILVSITGFLLAIKIYSVIDSSARTIGNSAFAIFLAIEITLVMAAIRIKGWSDVLNQGIFAITVRFDFNDKLKYYIIALYFMTMGVIFLVIARGKAFQLALSGPMKMDLRVVQQYKTVSDTDWIPEDEEEGEEEEEVVREGQREGETHTKEGGDDELRLTEPADLRRDHSSLLGKQKARSPRSIVDRTSTGLSHSQSFDTSRSQSDARRMAFDAVLAQKYHSPGSRYSEESDDLRSEQMSPHDVLDVEDDGSD